MGVDKVGVDEMGVDEMGNRRSWTTQSIHIPDCFS